LQAAAPPDATPRYCNHSPRPPSPLACRPADSIVSIIPAPAAAANSTNSTAAGTSADEVVPALLVLAPAGSGPANAQPAEQPAAQDPNQFSLAEFENSATGPQLAASGPITAVGPIQAAAYATAALAASCIAGCGSTAGRQVCGADRRTHNSSCVAACLRVPIRHRGACTSSEPAATNTSTSASSTGGTADYSASGAEDGSSRLSLMANVAWPTANNSALIKLPRPIKLLRQKGVQDVTAARPLNASSNVSATPASKPAATANASVVVPVPEQRPQAILSLGEQPGPGDSASAASGDLMDVVARRVGEAGAGSAAQERQQQEEVGEGLPNGMLPVVQLAAQAAQRTRAQRMKLRLQQGG
jgi:hypothetical protein